MSSSGVCLDIAIDHRIKRLFIAVQLPVGTALPDSDNDEAFNDIADFTTQYIRALELDEINVTKRLAGPYGVTGGILVMLQQPAEDHQFHKGTAATVRECMTLKELHNTFHTVSRGTVGIADINVLDITPFVRPSDSKDLNPSVREGLQHHVLETVKERKPAVVMCASQSYGTAGPLKCFAGLGVGKTIFERHNAEGDQPFKVNAFHPSYALNFYPWDPDCRQLLLLEAIHVCRRWSGDWVEEDWMLELRERCRVSSETRYAENAHQRSTPEGHLEAAIQNIAEAVSSITESIDLAFSGVSHAMSSEATYYKCQHGGVGQRYNKLSLSLKEVRRLQTTGYAHVKDQQKRNSLQRELCVIIAKQQQNIELRCASIPGSFPLVKRVGDCVLNIQPGTSGRYDPEFIDHNFIDTDNLCLSRWRQMLTECVRHVNDAWTCTQVGHWETSLAKLQKASLDCAIKVELLLGSFREEMGI